MTKKIIPNDLLNPIYKLLKQRKIPLRMTLFHYLAISLLFCVGASEDMGNKWYGEKQQDNISEGVGDNDEMLTAEATGRAS